VVQLQVDEPQSHAGVRVLRREQEAAVQEKHALIELAEVHIAEAQVVEEVGILGVLAELLLASGQGYFVKI
jgi:hypothetical protein